MKEVFGLGNGGLVVVDSSVLPEVFLKVLEVKILMASREEKSCASACKRVGISRSAFYKYKDCIFAAHEELITERIVNLYILLKDIPGALSGVLVLLHDKGANILTVNQSIPVDGVASINISLKFPIESGAEISALRSLEELDGVVKVKILSAK